MQNKACIYSLLVLKEVDDKVTKSCRVCVALCSILNISTYSLLLFVSGVCLYKFVYSVRVLKQDV